MRATARHARHTAPCCALHALVIGQYSKQESHALARKTRHAACFSDTQTAKTLAIKETVILVKWNVF